MNNKQGCHIFSSPGYQFHGVPRTTRIPILGALWNHFRTKFKSLKPLKYCCMSLFILEKKAISQTTQVGTAVCHYLFWEKKSYCQQTPLRHGGTNGPWQRLQTRHIKNNNKNNKKLFADPVMVPVTKSTSHWYSLQNVKNIIESFVRLAVLEAEVNRFYLIHNWFPYLIKKFF